MFGFLYCSLLFSVCVVSLLARKPWTLSVPPSVAHEDLAQLRASLPSQLFERNVLEEQREERRKRFKLSQRGDSAEEDALLEFEDYDDSEDLAVRDSRKRDALHEEGSIEQYMHFHKVDSTLSKSHSHTSNSHIHGHTHIHSKDSRTKSSIPLTSSSSSFSSSSSSSALHPRHREHREVRDHRHREHRSSKVSKKEKSSSSPMVAWTSSVKRKTVPSAKLKEKIKR